jgi:signal transduction histidine kinase/CheY-like chemotaxis protein
MTTFPPPRSLLAILAMLLLAVLGWPALAAAQPSLSLDSGRDTIDAWPAVTVLVDAAGTLQPEQALAAPQRFSTPTQARATLGVHKDVVWLRIPVNVPAYSDGQWVLSVDYAVINRIDVYVTTNGAIDRHMVTGNLQPVAEHAPRLRVPAVQLQLTPGAEHVLLMRVENIGAMILPVQLSRAPAFHASALNEQMLQGVLLGLCLCLLLYSLAQWQNLREPLFGKFALMVAGLSLFSVEFFGLGNQYLWHNSVWMSIHAGGLFALAAACGAYLFVEQVLARPGQDRLFSRLMKSGAALCVVAALAYATDLITVAALVTIVSTLGILPMLIGLPGAFLRARRGDAVGVYLLLGWSVSFATSVVLSLVINGALAANFWTMHALQFGNIFDMLLFMRILGLRTRDMELAMLRAQEATRAKSEFLAHMSHEIRTPMNAIIGMSRLALMSGPDPKLHNYLGKILGAGEHLLAVLNDILDFSRIEAGKMRLETVPFDLADVLDPLASMAPADSGGPALAMRVQSGVPTRLSGDPLRLRQVMINLVSNAFKFTAQGEVTVAVELVAQAPGSVVLRFSVCDTGIGMDAAQVQRLFQAFSQADDSIARKYGGTGLGLSICQQLVKLMDGDIQVSSTPGAGSRFSFTVRLGVSPVDAMPVRGMAPTLPVPSDPAALDGARILLAEDNANNREVALDFLAAARIQVDIACDGAEAVHLVQAGDYDLVLMDIQMPGVDGLTATRRIRAIDRHRHLPIIAMTAHALPADREKSLAAGMNDHITKPIEPALLFATLLKWIPAASLAGRQPFVAPAMSAPLTVASAPVPLAASLPAVPGIDWEHALLRVDGQRHRLHKRMRGFLHEYAAMPATIRAVLANGDHAPLQSVAHDLKATAPYIGALTLAALAHALEQELMAGRPEAIDRLARELATGLEPILAALAELTVPEAKTGLEENA